MVRKPTTWSIKGIEEDVRDIARAAAERDQQNIGSWIDHAIRVHGGQRPRGDAGVDAGMVAESAEMDSEHRDAAISKPAGPGLTDQALLDIIDRELDASTSRLDRALRPMGLALLDLAERMVSVERERLGQAPMGTALESEASESAIALGASEVADDDFGPEAPPRSLDEWSDGPDPESHQAVAQTAQPDRTSFPAPPSHDLAPDFDGHFDSLDVPPLPDEETDRAREIDRRLRALAGEVDAVDALDTDPPPPTGDLGPTEIIIDAPVIEREPEPKLELPMAFRGVQQSAFDSGPKAVAGEVAFDLRRQRRRRLRRILLGTSGLAAALVVALYVFSGQIGLGPLRQELDSRLKPVAHNIAEGTKHLWTDMHVRVAPLIEQAKTAVLGPGRPETSEPDNAPSDHVEAAPPLLRTAPDQSGENESPGENKDNIAREAVPAQIGEDAPAVPNVAEFAPKNAESETPASAGETGPAAIGEIAPYPAPIEPSIPVPDAAPAPKVSEAPPPPAPVLPASPAVEPTDMVASRPPGGELQTGAREALEQRADAGDPKAQHDLALAYLTGTAGTENPERAAELLREAAIQGLPSAQYNLAVLYETGQGVRQDDVRALLWYHSAAEQGHPNAQYNLGVMYAEGRGIPLNFEEAARWFQAAAKQGMARALYNLAVMNDEGLGVVQDKKKAVDLFRAAAEAGDQRAIEMLSGSTVPATGRDSALNGAILNGSEGVQSASDVPAVIIAAIQEELTRLGFYSGRIDGLMGPKTRAAIRAFEISDGLEESGEATEALLEQLKGANP